MDSLHSTSYSSPSFFLERSPRNEMSWSWMWRKGNYTVGGNGTGPTSPCLYFFAFPSLFFYYRGEPGAKTRQVCWTVVSVTELSAWTGEWLDPKQAARPLALSRLLPPSPGSPLSSPWAAEGQAWYPQWDHCCCEMKGNNLLFLCSLPPEWWHIRLKI